MNASGVLEPREIGSHRPHQRIGISGQQDREQNRLSTHPQRLVPGPKVHQTADSTDPEAAGVRASLERPDGQRRVGGIAYELSSSRTVLSWATKVGRSSTAVECRTCLLYTSPS